MNPTHAPSAPPPPPATSEAPTPRTPPRRANRRRKRSESDRKKHAGWRSCPRCAKSVSTNGRNFYHHMHKCDPVFFADLIARVDVKRTQATHAPTPHARMLHVPHPPHLHPHANPLALPLPPPLGSPTTPLRGAPARSLRGCLSEAQYVLFVTQLCFLRTYDSTVDAVFRRLESSPLSMWGVFSTAIFEQIRHAKRDQMRYIAPATVAPSLSAPLTAHTPAKPAPAPVKQMRTPPQPPVIPTTAASPLSSHSPFAIASRLTPVPPPALDPAHTLPSAHARPPSTMSISSVINN